MKALINVFGQHFIINTLFYVLFAPFLHKMAAILQTAF